MRILRSYRGSYFTLGPTLNKVLEIGARRERSDFKFLFRFNARGAEAGLTFFFQFWKFFFEFNIRDIRQWNYDANRFYLPGEKPEFTGYPF